MSAFTPLLGGSGHQRASCAIPTYEYTTEADPKRAVNGRAASGYDRLGLRPKVQNKYAKATIAAALASPTKLTFAT
jgi:hypothetical protein